MSQLHHLLHSYPFLEQSLGDRFFKHADLQKIIDKFRRNPLFEITEAGRSFEGRSIDLIKVGGGTVKIFLWSQMHGNEPTATMALMDLLNFLSGSEKDYTREMILQNCTLYILPMVNPDGAEVFTRRNAQEIDINRIFMPWQVRKLKYSESCVMRSNRISDLTCTTRTPLGRPANSAILPLFRSSLLLSMMP